MTGDSETGHSGRHSPELQGREGPVDRTAGGYPAAEDWEDQEGDGDNEGRSGICFVNNLRS